MPELVVATRNKKKLREIKEILKLPGLKLSSLADYPKAPRIIENGKTFKENAAKKAVKAAYFYAKLALGEDSGLCVQALGGAPGVYSSRFSGKDKSDAKNNARLLKVLGGVPYSRRKAYYACAVALADKEGLIAVVEGKCSGVIGFELKGKHGFGYDPLFVIPEYNKTFAQLGERIKHKMSHRFRALEKIEKVLTRYLRACPQVSSRARRR
ncbi:MAG TPA: RdgB/HAM1 family non-canonical purine NTP pyrophosphatase [Candidatus Margulisiibacteriota bacterium]|nr:RdgB/HAM1 family non-canonical purine NTP pyrophosphatase [Candidatus Margulisiibacteriota bacterium]